MIIFDTFDNYKFKKNVCLLNNITKLNKKLIHRKKIFF